MVWFPANRAPPSGMRSTPYSFGRVTAVRGARTETSRRICSCDGAAGNASAASAITLSHARAIP